MNRRRYPSDLTDAQWKLIERLVPPPLPGGRPAKHSRRELVNAILYRAREGCRWRALPHDLPPHQTVWYYFRRWQTDGTWQRVHDALRTKVRRQQGRKPKPKVIVIDSQSAKGTEQGGPRGYDAGKKVLGRKRFIAVDTQGWVWALLVLPASASDKAGGIRLLELLRAAVRRLKLVRGDSAFAGALSWAWAKWGWGRQVVRRPAGQRGFAVQPGRWVVERTYGWRNRFRILSKEYERTVASSEANIRVAMTHIMLRRLTR